MNSFELNKIKTHIASKWTDGPALDLRIMLLQSILSECEEDRHPSITVGQIRKHTELDVPEILEFMEFLCSDQIFLFSAQFHIYDAGKFHPVTSEYVCEALEQGFIEIPGDTRRIKYEDIMKRVTLYYEPTSSLEGLLGPNKDSSNTSSNLSTKDPQEVVALVTRLNTITGEGR